MMNRPFLLFNILLFLLVTVVPSPVTGYDDESEYSYSFVHLSDIQTLTTAYPSTLNLVFSEIEDLKCEYNIEAIFITGDLTNEYDGGPGDGVDFSRYAYAVGLTTIPVYEIAGNHDVYAIGNYSAWDMYVPSGSTKHNYGFVFNDFIVYGFGWSGETSLNPGAKTAMRNAIAANPSKVPLILTHAYMWPNGVRLPIAYDILDALPRNSIIMSGHKHNAVQNGLIRQTVYNDITVIEDLINYQDWGRFSGGRLYSVTTDGSEIGGLEVSDLYLYPDLYVNNPRSYDLFSEWPPDPESIIVLSPNGGESWAADTTQRITWTSSGDIDDVKIELLKGDAVVRTILSSTENDGSYSSWTIPTGLATGADYRVRITSTTDPEITDTSNGYFTINSGTSTASITVTSTPPEAKIFLDSVDTNRRTPYTLSNIPVGDHSVHVTKDGYITPEIQIITVEHCQTATADFNLRREPGMAHDPVTNFTAAPITGTVPLTVVFTDLSTNEPYAWNWTFGDGNATNATVQNPVHTYHTPGLYTVSLNATNVNGFNVTTKTGYINVTNTSSGIGVFRPSTRTFYLDYNGNGAWNGALVDRAHIFGLTGDLPVSGDWNLDGKTEIGVFRPSTRTFYLDYNGNGAWDGALVDRAHIFGLTGDLPVSGDWN